jgi:hypothetical protein
MYWHRLLSCALPTDQLRTSFHTWVTYHTVPHSNIHHHLFMVHNTTRRAQPAGPAGRQNEISLLNARICTNPLRLSTIELWCSSGGGPCRPCGCGVLY